MTNWETIAVPSLPGNFVSPLYRPAAVQSVISHLSFVILPAHCLFEVGITFHQTTRRYELIFPNI